MTTADRIKIRREELGLSQTDLAKRIGLSGKTSISRMETSGDRVTLKNVEKCAKALNCSISYLLGYEDNKETSNNDTNDYYINENTLKTAQMIRDNKELGLLFDAAKDASPEDLMTIQTMLLALKKKERQ